MKSKSRRVDVSLILTGYNEGEVLLKNLEKVRELLSGAKYRWEVILYDDASKDKTLETFKKFSKKHKNMRCYFNRKNLGRGGTVKKAMQKARGEYVGYIDTDLELSPIYLPEFINALKNGADVAIARRFYAVGASNFVRAILSRGYAHLVRLLLNINLNDTEAGFKFFDRKKILPLLKEIKDYRWFFDTEIVTRSVWAGLKITEVPVVYIYNAEKESSVNLVSDTINYFRKLIEFRKERPHANSNSNN